MYPILFRVSGHPIYSYTVLLDAGLLLGLLVAWWQARQRGTADDAGTVVDAAFWTIVGGVVGGRAGRQAAKDVGDQAASGEGLAQAENESPHVGLIEIHEQAFGDHQGALSRITTAYMRVHYGDRTVGFRELASLRRDYDEVRTAGQESKA